MACLRVTLQMACDSQLSLTPCPSTSWQAEHVWSDGEGRGGERSGAAQKTRERKTTKSEKRADDNRGG